MNYQFINAEYANGLTQEFYYDETGNRTRLVESGQRTKDVYYSYNDMNQLLSARSGTQWVYDALGNMTHKSTSTNNREYSYSPQNRMTAVKKNGLTHASYVYDVLGRKIAQTTAADTLQMAWDGWHTLADYDAAGALETRYLTTQYLDDYILQQDASGTNVYYLQDRVNSVVGLVDTTGALVGRHTYDAFGTVRDSSGMSDVRFTYTGRARGVGGLMYYRMRWYVPAQGRFGRVDPVALRNKRLNTFFYADNNPYFFNDPKGLSPSDDECEEVCAEAFKAGIRCGICLTVTKISAATPLGLTSAALAAVTCHDFYEAVRNAYTICNE